MSSKSHIALAERIYRELDIDALAKNGVARDHRRHYGMVVYPSIKSASNQGQSDVFGVPAHGKSRLYIHIPFCSGLCEFCHFQLAPTKFVTEYLECVDREFQLLRTTAPRLLYHGMFIGGGTPTSLNSKQLNTVIDSAFRTLNVNREGFNTIEIHPEFVRQGDAYERFIAMRERGLNRISIGAQAFDQDVLDSMARRHTVEENFRAIELAREAGFQYVDIDIMYGVPGQTLHQWSQTLSAVAGLPVDSVSIFYLIVKPGTAVANRPRSALPAARESVLMHIMAREALAAAGFVESLTDHFHRPQGPSADDGGLSAFLYSQFNIVPAGVSGWGYANSAHYWNSFDTRDYCSQVRRGRLPIVRAVHLSEDERIRRDLMFCLKYGVVDFSAFLNTYGVNVLEQYSYAFNTLQKLGLVVVDDSRALLSYRGRLYMEEACTYLFSDKVAGDQLRDGGSDPLQERFNYLVKPNRSRPVRILTVVAHPRKESLTHALHDVFRSTAADCGHEIETIDLYAEKYESVLTGDEIDGLNVPNEVGRHQAMLQSADILAVFCPIWWYSVPAILKGWYDRTFAKGFAFEFSETDRYRGLLQGKKLLVINTGADSHERFAKYWKEAYVHSQVHAVFDTVGMTQRCVRIFLNAHHRAEGERQRIIDEVAYLARHIGFPWVFETDHSAQVKSS